MKQPLLSIIVPIYKVEEFLEECIESILKQEFKDYELILVDDGSPDACGEICDDYAAKDSRIKVIHKTNGGQSSARNAGIDIAQGRYLSFIDSDDFISNDYYLKNMQYLTMFPNVDMLVAQVCYYDKIKNIIVYNASSLFNEKKHILEYMFSVKYIASPWINIYKKEIFQELRFPEGRIYEDAYLLPYIAQRVRLIHISNQGVYYYRQRENSTTSIGFVLNSYKDQLDAYNKILDYSSENNISKDIYMHHFLNYSHILLMAVREYGTAEFTAYLQSWKSYPFNLLDSVYAKSFKSFIEFLLLKIMGFKTLSIIIK